MPEGTETTRDPHTLVPNQAAFILWPLFTGTVGLGAVALGLLVAAPFAGIHLVVAGILVVPAFFLLLGLSIVSRIVQARKTSYTFDGDRIVFRTGGILSNRTIELQLRNVTQAELRIPFVENRIFGTGEVSVTSAGSEHAKVVLAHLDEAESVHELLQDRMRASGFSLARRERLLDTRPSFAALALREGGVMSMALVIFAVVIAVVLFPGGAEVMERLGLDTAGELLAFVARGRTPAGESAFQLRFALAGAAVGSVLLGLLILTSVAKQAAVHFTRRYTLHDDVVEYETTLFGLNRVVIPIENLADVTTRQGPFGRLFRIADVELSCQGATRAISFHALPDALRFRETLRGVLDSGGMAAATAIAGASAQAAPMSGTPSTPLPFAQPALPPSAPPTAPATAPPSAPPSAPPLEYRPFFRRDAAAGIWRQIRSHAFPFALLVTSPLTLPLVPLAGFDASRWLSFLPLALAVLGGVFAIALIVSITGAWLRTAAKRYEVGGGKLSATHTRVSRTEVEFTFSQITSVVVIRSILDRLMGTATIYFYSIGAQHPVVFEHLRKGPEATAEILARLRLPDGEPLDVIRPRVGPGLYLLGRPGAVAGFVLLIGAGLAGGVLNPFAFLAVPVILLIASWRLLLDLIALRHSSLEIHNGHLVGARGVFRRVRHAAPLRQIKDLRCLTYPVSRHGTLTFFAAGGASFGLPFVREAHAQLDRLDVLLHAHPQHVAVQPGPFDAAPVLAASPDLRAALIRTALLSLLVIPAGAPIVVLVGTLVPPLVALAIPLLLLAPLILLVGQYVRLRRIRYELQESRVVRTGGIMRRSRFTVLLDRIDYLSTSQGPLHRMFGTGDVSIYTTGSAQVELVLGDLRGYTDWLAPIESRLPRERAFSSTSSGAKLHPEHGARRP